MVRSGGDQHISIVVLRLGYTLMFQTTLGCRGLDVRQTPSVAFAISVTRYPITTLSTQLCLSSVLSHVRLYEGGP